MKPTQGRIVLFKSHDQPHVVRVCNGPAMAMCPSNIGIVVPPGQYPAMVAAVHPDGEKVDLHLFPPGQPSFCLNAVPHAQDDQPTAWAWHWPPRV